MEMNEALEIIKKLNFKDLGQTVLVLNSPASYENVMSSFQGEVHREPANDFYDFVQVFGTSSSELQALARQGAALVDENDGLLWLCYPKKTSKVYKGSDCSRESVAPMLSAEGFEPVRQIAIDEDWSALRFRRTEKIKSMVRKFAMTEQGKQRIGQKE
jgi:hypothetical protein